MKTVFAIPTRFRVYTVTPGGQVNEVAGFLSYQMAADWATATRAEFGVNILLLVVEGTIHGYTEGTKP